MYRRGVFNCDYSLFSTLLIFKLLSNFELNQAVISGMVTVYILWYVLITTTFFFSSVCFGL
uniref:Uncharacterized protein n=1 Tax=Paramormyrops kingsleyae TaxID=1676925 RepID=A0A3B3Q2G2_9TELE